MKKIGLLENMVLGDYAQNSKINEAADWLASLKTNQRVIYDQVKRLFDLDRRQEYEIRQLKAMVLALSELLVEKGVADETELSERLHAAMSQVEGGG